jgi:hypothetical protein
VGTKLLTSALDVTSTYARDGPKAEQSSWCSQAKEFGSSETPQNERKEEKLEMVRLEQATIDNQFVSVRFGYDDKGNQEYAIARKQLLVSSSPERNEENKAPKIIH